MLEIKEISKSIKDKQIVSGISFDVQSGDIFGLLGPNGAGKSTVIGIISSLINITSGSVRVLGKDTLKYPDFAKRNIGLVPQEYNLCQFIPIEETMINVGGYFGLNRKQMQMHTI